MNDKKNGVDTSLLRFDYNNVKKLLFIQTGKIYEWQVAEIQICIILAQYAY